jgi:hypothetical protein
MQIRGIIDIRHFLMNDSDEMPNNHVRARCCFEFLGCHNTYDTQSWATYCRELDKAGWKEITTYYIPDCSSHDPSRGEITAYCCPQCAEKILDRQLLRILDGEA